VRSVSNGALGDALTSPSIERALPDFSSALSQRRARVISLVEAGMPDAVVLDPDVGLVAVDVVAGHNLDDQAPFRALNAKVQLLREWLQLEAGITVGRVVLDPDSQAVDPHVGKAGRIVLGAPAMTDASFMELIEPSPLSEQTDSAVAAALFPAFVFKSLTRSGARDAGKHEREAARILLDAQQMMAAQCEIGELGVVTGPPGSGKTLVLAARARWLSEKHPFWDIRVLCFNKTLMPYLMELLSGLQNVRVQRMYEFATDMRLPFSFSDDQKTRDGLEKALRLGHQPSVDALLIDEAQDFRPVWFDLVRACVVPGGGGVLAAGDSAQAIYHNGAGLKLRSIQDATHILLERPYRTTRRIMQALGDLDPEFNVEAAENAPDGEPVELIWAESWDQQAACVAWEITTMLSSGERSPGDIGILVTTRWGTFNRLSEALEKHKVPFTVVDKENADLFDRSEDAVKIMTVHAAKGHEFPVVFLFALEALPNIDPEDAATRSRARVGFVGGTRAKDQLLITYTRDNQFLRQLSTDDDDVRRWVWPDSYEGVSDG